MMWMPRPWAFVAAISVCAWAVQASINGTDPTESPYRIFVDRNPFNIRPLPVQTNVVVQPKEQAKIDLKLTGITLFGKRKAYFQMTEQASPNKQAKVEFISLGVDEKDKGIEVLEIDEVNRSVKIRQEGVETLVTFSSHGIAAPASTGPVQIAGAGGIPVPGINMAAGNLMSANAAANVNTFNAFNATATPVLGTPPGTARTLATIPSRPLRTTPTGSMDANLAARYGLVPGTLNAAPVVRAPDVPQHNLSTEEQQLLMELQKVSRPDVVFPPTPGLDFGNAPPAPGGVPTPMPALPGQR